VIPSHNRRAPTYFGFKDDSGVNVTSQLHYPGDIQPYTGYFK